MLIFPDFRTSKFLEAKCNPTNKKVCMWILPGSIDFENVFTNRQRAVVPHE